jgi:chemotaxis protein methyltransferase CheR
VTDAECVEFLHWALPALQLRWEGFRRVRRQVGKRLARRLRALELPDLAAYRRHLQTHPEEWGVLDACCRITISRFYRDRGVFRALETRVLPALAQAARDDEREALRVWSAGCGSGEEVYTLRALWDLRLAPRFPELGLLVVGTDADPALLERARRGRFGASSLADLPAAWRSRIFERRDDVWQLRPELHRGVELRCEDLREAAPPGTFDLILCRNLAFTYFDAALQRGVLARLIEHLVPGGALVVGAHESLPVAEALVPWEDARAIHRLRPAWAGQPVLHGGS